MSSATRTGMQMGRQVVASPVVETIMRLGYGVRGLVYLVIGLLALEVAIGDGGTLADPQGAVVALGHTPVGAVLLYGVLIGLIGYSLWGFVRALFDPLHKGSDAKGIATRVGYAASGVSYALLAVATFGLLTGQTTPARNGAQTTQTQQTTASVLSHSWGPWAVGIAGVLVLAIGVLQIVQGARGTFDQRFEPYALSPSQARLIDRIGRFGTAARGFVFGLIGLFLALAAYTHDPNQAQGINGTLAALLHQPFGRGLLGVVALGLVAFGLYSMMSAIWLRFKRS